MRPLFASFGRQLRSLMASITFITSTVYFIKPSTVYFINISLFLFLDSMWPLLASITSTVYFNDIPVFSSSTARGLCWRQSSKRISRLHFFRICVCRPPEAHRSSEVGRRKPQSRPQPTAASQRLVSLQPTASQHLVSLQPASSHPSSRVQPSSSSSSSSSSSADFFDTFFGIARQDGEGGCGSAGETGAQCGSHYTQRLGR